MMLLSLLANAHGQVVSGPHSPIITVETTGLGLPEARYVDGDFESSRILHDLDQNGWCNLWCALFEVDPAQLTSISDAGPRWDDGLLRDDSDAKSPAT